LFKNMCVVDDNLYVLTQRYLADGSTSEAGLFLEKLTTDDVYLDQYYNSATTANTFTGAQGLENETVSVIADGLTHPTVTVTAAGNFTLSRNSSSTQIGYAYASTLKTLPLQVAGANITTLGERVRKVMAELQFYNTKHCRVDGFSVPFRAVGSALLDQAVQPFSGQKRIRLSGYDRTPQITIINDLGLPLVLLSLTTELKVGTGKLQEAG
jgi:hypothetical protein